MQINLEPHAGLPVRWDAKGCVFLFDKPLNPASFYARSIHDLDPVWANPVEGQDRTLYSVTSALCLAGDEALWTAARIGYGLVCFAPGVIGGEYVKSSGQYHAILPGHTMATPEIYTVLAGCGHFLLQRSKPPYEDITDAVLVEVNAGESFVVPPDYGHLQINPAPEPLVFSYVVMNPLASNYEPYRRCRGAIYYEMAQGPERFVFNPRYSRQVPLRQLQAAQLRQLPFLGPKPDYALIRRCLPQLGFLANPTAFPPEAYL